MRDLTLMATFRQWLYEKYRWDYSYFCRICGEARQEEIWNEFYREQELKKHRE